MYAIFFRGLLVLPVIAGTLLAQQPRVPVRARGTARSAPVADVTFSNQIAPIFQQNCQECHHPGEVAPFSLMTYEDALPNAEAIREETQRRYMPPWKPVPGFGEFQGERLLTDDEIALIARWVDAGAPEGDPLDLPEPLVFSDQWTLGEPDLVIAVDRPYTPNPLGEDDYRCFSIPSGLLEDRFVGAVEVRPGNRRIAHHVLLFPDPVNLSAELESPGQEQPGYQCFGDPGFTPSGLLGGWAPGNRPQVLPDDVAYGISAGGRIVIQVHYHPDGTQQSDLTRVGFFFSSHPSPKQLLVLPLANTEFEIPPGASRHEVKATVTIPAFVSANLFNVTPHMHLLGREIRLDLFHPGGQLQPLIYIDDWDFEWQDTYHFKEPIAVGPSSRLELTTIFDNSLSNPHNPNNPPKAIRWGPQTTDEMCLALIGFTLE